MKPQQNNYGDRIIEFKSAIAFLICAIEKNNNSILGGDGNDFLSAGVGNDISEGGNGNDFLIADVGFDTLTGGAGSDRFFFNGSTVVDSVDGIEPFNSELISDFERGVDRIELFGFDLTYADLDSNNNGILDGGDILIGAGGDDLSINVSDEFGVFTAILVSDTNELDSTDVQFFG